MTEFSFVVSRPQVVTATLFKDDLNLLNKVMRDCLMSHVAYHDFGSRIEPYESEVVELCERYGVNPECSKDRVALFTALLKTLDS